MRDLTPLKTTVAKPVLQLAICSNLEGAETTLITKLQCMVSDCKSSGTAPLQSAYQFIGTHDSKVDLVEKLFKAEIVIVLADSSPLKKGEIFKEIVVASIVNPEKLIVAIDCKTTDQDAHLKFEAIRKEYEVFTQKLGFKKIAILPINLAHGDNITSARDNISWHKGPSLLDSLVEQYDRPQDASKETLRLLIQSENYDQGDGKVKHSYKEKESSANYLGLIVSGTLTTGDSIQIQPSGKISTVTKIDGDDGVLKIATIGQAMRFALDEPHEILVGDIISHADSPAEVADQFEVNMIWQSKKPLLPGRQYQVKIGTYSGVATITAIKYEINLETLEHIPATHLNQDSISCCNVKLDRPIPFDAYRDNKNTGRLTFIDTACNQPIGYGFIHFALRRSHNIYMQSVDIDQNARALLKRQKPRVIWFTGLSGSGKSTIANLVEKQLHLLGMHTYLLDGDNIRHGLNKDLGFTDEDRVENIRRISEVAKLMVDAGLIVLTAFISPFRSERQMARELFATGEFIEVYIDTPLELAEKRDPKGLYKKARKGELMNFTGIDSPYEKPENPEIILKTSQNSAENLANEVCNFLQKMQVPH